MRVGRIPKAVKRGAVLGAVMPGAVHAHVAEQGFVLLLPTDVYIGSGVTAVVLTVLALLVLPEMRGGGARRWAPREVGLVGHGLSLLCLAVLFAMLWIGLTGPRDPLSNVMPMVFWTLGWVGLISVMGVVGDVWAWVNPWTGLYAALGRPAPLVRLPEVLGRWPAVLLLLGCTGFLLADVAPDDPARLAWIVGVYWFASFAGLVVFGPAWLRRAELGHAMSEAYGQLAALSVRRGGAGLPGWQVRQAVWVPGAGVFAVLLLATGSFDGLNETFWWLAVIGVNPLEFPGRSAVVGATLTGLLASCAGLLILFALVVRLGCALAGGGPFRAAFHRFALSLLPIAFVYHVAHYLPSFLVSVQYAIAALSDPLARGDDLLGIEPFYVTTGFFNVMETVRVIWLSQAGLVVAGHVWSVILAHGIALDLFGTRAKAVRATLPLSAFMIAYTFLGLWLLAAPRGA